MSAVDTREMKEREAKLASKKLEDLTDEEFFEVIEEAEWQKFWTQENVEEKQTEQAFKSSQNEQAGPSSCKSRDHIFEFTPGSQPSFNLGFDSPLVGPKPSKEKEPNDEEKEYRYLQSPYMYEKVSTTEELTDDEILLARSIFCMQGNEAEQVFRDQSVELRRMNVQSLAPGLKIETPVIDTFASILNHEERELEKDIKRHYFYTSMMVPGIIQDKPEPMETKIEKQYEEFSKLVLIQMEDDISKLQFEDVDLVFFPVIAYEHYYLIVFNILKGTSVIIDNSDSVATYEEKYKGNYEFVSGVFAKHLSTYLHPKAEDYMNEKKKPRILNMKWKTKKEKIDCGLYMMMHMEKYEGKKKWETGMLEETNKNHQIQTNNLRAKYAAKMMLHEVNEKKKIMSDYALKFASENPDNKEAEKIANEAIMKKIAEQDEQDKKGK